jgi:hypothetical protein
VNTPAARQWLSSRHVTAAIDTYVTTDETLEPMFSVRSVPKIYREDQIPLPVNPGRVRVRVESLEPAERESAGRQSVEK